MVSLILFASKIVTLFLSVGLIACVGGLAWASIIAIRHATKRHWGFLIALVPLGVLTTIFAYFAQGTTNAFIEAPWYLTGGNVDANTPTPNQPTGDDFYLFLTIGYVVAVIGTSSPTVSQHNRPAAWALSALCLATTPLFVHPSWTVSQILAFARLVSGQ